MILFVRQVALIRAHFNFMGIGLPRGLPRHVSNYESFELEVMKGHRTSLCKDTDAPFFSFFMNHVQISFQASNSKLRCKSCSMSK